mgnify:CR=1 FL=1
MARAAIVDYIWLQQFGQNGDSGPGFTLCSITHVSVM